MKIVRAVLDIYECCVHGRTDRPTDNLIFYKFETYLDRYLVLEMYVIENFMKIVLAFLKIYEICFHRHNDRQTILFFTRLRPI